MRSELQMLVRDIQWGLNYRKISYLHLTYLSLYNNNILLLFTLQVWLGALLYWNVNAQQTFYSPIKWTAWKYFLYKEHMKILQDNDHGSRTHDHNIKIHGVFQLNFVNWYYFRKYIKLGISSNASNILCLVYKT